MFNFSRRIFLYLYIMSLKPTVWLLFAAEILIFGDFAVREVLNDILEGKESSNQNDSKVLFSCK